MKPPEAESRESNGPVGVAQHGSRRLAWPRGNGMGEKPFGRTDGTRQSSGGAGLWEARPAALPGCDSEGCARGSGRGGGRARGGESLCVRVENQAEFYVDPMRLLAELDGLARHSLGVGLAALRPEDAGQVVYRAEEDRPLGFPEPASGNPLAGVPRNFQVFEPLDFLEYARRERIDQAERPWEP